MEAKDVYTQEELEKAIAESFTPVCRGDGQFVAWENSQVTAWENSQVTAWGNSHVTASKYNAVTVSAQHTGKVTGGVQIKVPPIKTAEEWCEFYGVPIKRGIAILYKAVNDVYYPTHNIAYVPGTKPVAPDWDGGKEECGGGLHFSPTPGHALEFNSNATKFVACPVKLSEIVVHFPAEYPDKVKAPRVYRPCYEVDINGKRVAEISDKE